LRCWRAARKRPEQTAFRSNADQPIDGAGKAQIPRMVHRLIDFESQPQAGRKSDRSRLPERQER
jgi:hypothetical protein